MIQETEISKEDLFRKIDTLKIKCFDKEDALKSAETRIQELNKCNDYANEEIERLNNIINNTAVELEILLQSEDFELITMQLRNIVFRLKGSDKEWDL